LSNHLDSSSFHLHGEYTTSSTDLNISNQNGSDVNKLEVVEVTHMQLKQVVTQPLNKDG
jgi:hypothetical protein